jgi:hypothetical protein
MKKIFLTSCEVEQSIRRGCLSGNYRARSTPRTTSARRDDREEDDSSARLENYRE